MIDTSFNLRSDRPAGKDVDTWSPTLRTYHRLLWSKPLPSGKVFELQEAGRRGAYYLLHRSELGEFKLSSDAITNRQRNAPVRNDIPPTDLPPDLGYTVGSALIFPKSAIRGGSINQMRGRLRRAIGDRFDLTLECIRRHYVGEASPLGEVLARHSDFFALFGSFPGYVDFFLLGDLVSADGSVRFWTPFDDFKTPAVPRGVEIFLGYLRGTNEFIKARNRLIDEYAASHLAD